MAITITWSVKDMHKVIATGAVYKVDWECSGIDEDTKTTHSRSGEYTHKETTTVTPEVFAPPLRQALCAFAIVSAVLSSAILFSF